jgi:hypothetical protein
MGVYDPPNAHYAHIKVNEATVSTMLRMIGKEGCNFKRWTDKYNLKYLWWNKENKVVEIWGTENAVAHAGPKLEKIINTYLEKQEQNEIDMVTEPQMVGEYW